MTTRYIRRALTLAIMPSLLLVLAACSGPPPQPLRFGQAVWLPGETSVYGITDVDGQYAGTARYVLAALQDGGWRLERLTETQGAEEMLTVDMEANGFRPRASVLIREDGGDRQRVEASYNQGEVSLSLARGDDASTRDVVNVPSDSRDARALFMLIRTLPLAAGYSTRVNSFSPVTSRLARTTFSVSGSEQVVTPAGTFDAWLVTLDEGDRRSRAWIAKEAPHALVKYVDATSGGTFELTEFLPGE